MADKFWHIRILRREGGQSGHVEESLWVEAPEPMAYVRNLQAEAPEGTQIAFMNAKPITRETFEARTS
jgi:hypothetical protein